METIRINGEKYKATRATIDRINATFSRDHQWQWHPIIRGWYHCFECRPLWVDALFTKRR